MSKFTRSCRSAKASAGAMPLLRTMDYDGLVCKFYDGGVVKVGTTAADRFTFRLKDDDNFPARFKKEREEHSAKQQLKHQGRELYRKRPTAEQELKAISAKNQKIYDERLEAKQAAAERNAEERQAARTADPCLCTKEGTTELLRQSQAMLHDSRLQTAEAVQVATKATKATNFLTRWLESGSQLA